VDRSLLSQYRSQRQAPDLGSRKARGGERPKDGGPSEPAEGAPGGGEVVGRGIEHVLKHGDDRELMPPPDKSDRDEETHRRRGERKREPLLDPTDSGEVDVVIELTVCAACRRMSLTRIPSGFNRRRASI
jgi:hypothetical protein